MQGLEQLKQKRVRTFRGLEIQKSLEILAADIIKQAKTKEKMRKVYIQQTKKTNSEAEISLKEETLGRSPPKRYSESFMKWTKETNTPKDKKVIDDARSLTFNIDYRC